MRYAFLPLVISLLLTTTAPGQQRGAPAQSIEIRNVSVIDVTAGTVKPNLTVTISDGRIAVIDQADRSHVAPDVQVVDGSGKFLIPGLWDMHVHWYDERFLPLFTANGVTGIRQMWGRPMHFDWRERVEANQLVAPRQYIASTVVDGPNPVWPESLVVADAAEARTAVEKLKGLGFDMVKVYVRLPRDAYFSIAAESKARGISFGGHVPRAVTALEAAKAGQRSIEHLSGVLDGTSSAEEQVRSRRAELLTGGEASKGLDVGTCDALLELNERLLATYDDAKASDLFAAFASHGTWNCPTLTVLRSTAWLDDPAFTSDPRLKYMPVSIRDSWMPNNDARLAPKRPVDYALDRRIFRKLPEVTRAQSA